MNLAAYAELFRTEAREHLEAVDRALLVLERGPAPAEVDRLFRGMHTIKGMAAAMGYRTVERLAHGLESRCEPLRAQGAAPLPGTLALLFEGTDRLREAVDRAGHEEASEAAPPDAFLDRLAQDAQRAHPEGSLETPASPAPDLPPRVAGEASAEAPGGGGGEAPPGVAARARVVEVHLHPDCAFKGGRALLVLRRLEAAGTVQGTEPPQERWLQEGFSGRFAVTVRSGAPDELLARAAESAGEVARVAVRPEPGGSRPDGAVRTVRTVRLDARRLDTLLDLVSELVITRDRLLRQVEATAVPDRSLRRTAQELGRLVSAMQEEVLHTRMLPVSQVFDRFPRLVRDLAQSMGKDVRLELEGRTLEADRSLLDALAEPVVHLIRNAIDHGIEAPEERRRTGKAPKGRLRLAARRERAGIVVQVEDDGAGIDRGRVLALARTRGVVGDEVAALDDKQLLQVLAHPGFSTASRITEVSGRGVGVDVVASAVRALGGSLALASTAGRGTVFTLRFPLTLAIARALLVEAGGGVYAIPAAQVLETLEFDPAMLVSASGREGITLRDEVVPLVRLADRFGVSRGGGTEPSAPDGPAPLAVVEAAGRRLALLLDAVLAQQDIVVKPVDLARGGAAWFSGATLLGDGTPALIVDVAALA